MAEIHGQMLAVLVRDLGYRHVPRYGWHAVRHQYAWELATAGMTKEQVETEVAKLLQMAEAEGEIVPDHPGWR